MSLSQKKIVIAVLGLIFLGSLVLVQWEEVSRKAEETGQKKAHITVPETSKTCVDCHKEKSAGIVAHWEDSTHAAKGVGCLDCHQADKEDVDSWSHEGSIIATIVTPFDCARCHEDVQKEFSASHHAAAGKILHSLDNRLAETVEGSRVPFNPH